MSSFAIRRALPADALPLQRLFHDCRARADWLPTKVRFEANLVEESKGETILVAIEDSGEVLGFVSVWEPESFVHHLYVRPDRMRIGIGRALLHSLKDFLPFPWRLKCPPGNVAALAFYARLGWRQIRAGGSEWGPYFLLEYGE